MLGIPLGLFYANAAEWYTHKYFLHKRGKNKNSWAAFHWHDHHNICRKYDNWDVDYNYPWWKTKARRKEVYALSVAALLHLPLAPIAPFFTATVFYSAYNYYRKHKKAHTNRDWCRNKLTWHYDHHMGPNQDANWCVTRPWFDWLMGTRERYIGTHKEFKDQERRAKQKERRLKLV